jgi:tRNA pseudouridine55 synthase
MDIILIDYYTEIQSRNDYCKINLANLNGESYPAIVDKISNELTLDDYRMGKITILQDNKQSIFDLEGEIIASAPCPGLDLEYIKTALDQFIGKIEQIPPSYSAIQVDGKRLYDLARKGEIVEVPVRTVEISQIQVLDWRDGDFPELDVAISCGTGTYIRAIARDLGTTLNIGGTLSALIRTESSSFQIPTSLTFTDLATQIENGTFQPISPDTPLQHLQSLSLSAESAKKWCQGQKIPLNLAISDFVRVYETQTNFLGIGKLENDLLVPQMVFYEYPNYKLNN